MDEDDLYRSSSQYRLWSFTPQQLQERRAETNRTAAARAQAAFSRVYAKSINSETGNDTAEPAIDPLTVEEEQKVVQFFCQGILQLKSGLGLSSSIVVSSQITCLISLSTTF